MERTTEEEEIRREEKKERKKERPSAETVLRTWRASGGCYMGKGLVCVGEEG
jgi:hypothetical protein